MVRRIVQCSHPTLKGKRNLSNPKPPLMIPSISTNTKQAQFFLFFIFILFYFYLFFFFGPNSILSQSNKKNPKPPILTDPFNLRILDQSLQVERRVWQTWLVALGRERIIITQGKTEAKWIEMIETGLTGRRCEDAKSRRKETSNDARKNKRRMTPCP